MSDIAIKVENISKQYRLGLIGTGTILHDINRWWYTVRGKEDPYLKIGETNDRASKGSSKYVWALKDITFDVKQGEVIGIIGKNGAGKSTLLKILSRVTSPTTGSIKAKGRIASLLEVGTGFHPELTGRENIFMNGSIMGMSKAEIKRKMDEIVDFAGVERYIDTPVKRYSSGMTVRLGFAIAAHLEPEILVVDEVLAVGDAEFQKKAIGKMQDVSRGQGRTVLFVSHNMQAVSTLTQNSVLLKDGQILQIDKTPNVIQKYLLLGGSQGETYEQKPNKDKPNIVKVHFNTSHNNNIQQFGKSMEIIFEVYTPYGIPSAALSYQIINSEGIPVTHILNLYEENAFCDQVGFYRLKSKIPLVHLYPETYSLTVHFSDRITREKYETIENIVPFEVKVFDEIRDYYWGPRNAIYVEDSVWEVNKMPDKYIG